MKKTKAELVDELKQAKEDLDNEIAENEALSKDLTEVQMRLDSLTSAKEDLREVASDAQFFLKVAIVGLVFSVMLNIVLGCF